MRFGVLGALEVRTPSDAPIEVGSAKLRTLLTLLLADAGHVVPLDRVIDELWGESPPASATGTVQSYVSHLRRLLEPRREGRRDPEVLLTRSPGYLLVADAGSLDMLRLPALLDAAAARTRASDTDGAHMALREAVGLWRGDPLADLGDSARVVAERTRLAELNLVAREQLAMTEVRLGRPERAIADLEHLVSVHPLRESLWATLAEALYAGDRQADALEACRASAAVLREELGIEPGPRMRELEHAILRQELGVPLAPAALAVGGLAPAALAERELAPAALAEGALAPAALAAGGLAPAALAEGALAPAALADGGRPFVGRLAEQERIRVALADAARGSGAVLVLEGEAGIGKTRLAETAAQAAAANGWRTAWSRCADDAGAPALWPWNRALAQLAQPELATPDAGDPDQARFALFEDLRARLSMASEQKPTMVVLDDIQAADATSLQLIALLAQHLAGMRVIVLLTARTVGEELRAPVVACLSALARESRVHRVALSGLGEGDVRELLAAYLPEDGALSAAVVRERTDGNPFYVVELAQLMRSSSRVGDGAALLPQSVRDVMERRLALLSEETVAMLRFAAAAGREVDLNLLEVANDALPEQVIALLEPAVEAGILVADSVTWEWRFSHALVQETLLAGLSRVASARMHARLLEVLEHAGSTDIEALAHHAFHAAPVLGADPARRYALAAAQSARERLAHSDAAAQTRLALSLLGAAGDPRERHALLVALAEDLLHDGQLPESREAVSEALRIGRALGDDALLAQAASVWGGVSLWNWRPYGFVDEDLVRLLIDLDGRAGADDPLLRSRLLGALGVELAYSEQLNERLEYAQRAVTLARELDDPVQLGRALNNFVVAAWSSPVPQRMRLEATTEAIALSGRGLPARTEFFARLHRGPLLLHFGDLPGFEADLAVARRLAQSLSGPDVLPHLRHQEVGLAMVRGSWASAEEIGLQVTDQYARTSMWGGRFLEVLFQYTLRRHEGRLGDVVDLLVDAADIEVPLVNDIAVLAAFEAGDPAEARRLRRRWPQRLPRDWTADAAVVVHAQLAMALDGDVSGAYDQVLQYQGRQIVVGTGWAFWGAYDALLAQLARRLGRDDEADTHREDARRSALAMGSQWLLDGDGVL